MNVRQSTNFLTHNLFHVAICCAALGLSLTPTTFVVADDGEAAQPPGGKRAPSAGVRGPEGNVLIPRGGPGPAPAVDEFNGLPRRRNSDTLIGEPMGPGGPGRMGPGASPGMMSPGAGSGAPPEMLQKRMQELQQQQEQLAREYQEAMKGVRQSLPKSVQTVMEMQELQKRLAEANAQIAELSARQEHVMVAPLPDNAVLRAFALKYVKPEDIGQALHNITGGGGPRIAVDGRTNALLIAGTDKQMAVAEQLVQTLDQPGKSQQNKAAETVQVRVVWLLEGDRGLDPPKASIVSPQVVDALHELGFENPQVVCQQLTTLTLGQPDRRAQFHFQVPVLIDGSGWQFEGQGVITPTTDDRYAMEFNLGVEQPNNTKNCQLGGSILTPLGHYTVMGTTTFVGSSASSAPGPEGAGPQPTQHLSAFVVYLDQAKEFSGTDAVKPKEKAEKNR